MHGSQKPARKKTILDGSPIQPNFFKKFFFQRTFSSSLKTKTNTSLNFFGQPLYHLWCYYIAQVLLLLIFINLTSKINYFVRIETVIKNLNGG